MKKARFDTIKAAECLKVLAHPQRIEMLVLLECKPLSVGAIAEDVGMLPHVASQHLALMRRCGFIRTVKEGRSVVCSIAEPHLFELLACMRKKFS